MTNGSNVTQNTTQEKFIWREKYIPNPVCPSSPCACEYDTYSVERGMLYVTLLKSYISYFHTFSWCMNSYVSRRSIWIPMSKNLIYPFLYQLPPLPPPHACPTLTSGNLDVPYHRSSWMYPNVRIPWQLTQRACRVWTPVRIAYRTVSTPTPSHHLPHNYLFQ